MDRIRYVLDLQVAQSESRYGGIGRSSLDFARAIAKEAGERELWVVLNGLMPDSVESIRASFDGLIPQEHITVFSAPGPVSFNSEANDWRIRAAERLREAFIAGLKPDLVYIPSLIEGYNDNVVTSINSFSSGAPVVVSLHDLIPLLRPDVYLCDPRVKAWYLRKLQALKAADLLLAASESSRCDAVDYLNIPVDKVIAIRQGIDARFRPVAPALLEKTAIFQRYQITGPFILCSGAMEPGNICEDFVRGFSLLPPEIRAA